MVPYDERNEWSGKSEERGLTDWRGGDYEKSNIVAVCGNVDVGA